MMARMLRFVDVSGVGNSGKSAASDILREFDRFWVPPFDFEFDLIRGPGGLLELLDPRPFTEMVNTPGEPFGQKAIIRPRSGAMVIFPGWMYHFVNPYQGEGERISIAFNVRAAETSA